MLRLIQYTLLSTTFAGTLFFAYIWVCWAWAAGTPKESGKFYASDYAEPYWRAVLCGVFIAFLLSLYWVVSSRRSAA